MQDVARKRCFEPEGCLRRPRRIARKGQCAQYELQAVLWDRVFWTTSQSIERSDAYLGRELLYSATTHGLNTKVLPYDGAQTKLRIRAKQSSKNQGGEARGEATSQARSKGGTSSR